MHAAAERPNAGMSIHRGAADGKGARDSVAIKRFGGAKAGACGQEGENRPDLWRKAEKRRVCTVYVRRLRRNLNRPPHLIHSLPTPAATAERNHDRKHLLDEKGIDLKMKEKLGVYFNVHLVSDSTGETLSGVMRASCAQFDHIVPIEHSYFLIRSPRQVERVLREIEAAPGVVMYTIANHELRTRLEDRCKELNVPCVAVLDPVLDMFSRYLGMGLNQRIGGGRVLNNDYFRRIDALNFAMAHDDGQAVVELKDADVVLVGVSRTSKTPTSVYLANRGVKAANVPIVPNIPLPPELFLPDAPLVVGLTISADRLVSVRRNRLAAMNENRDSSYADSEEVRAEIRYAQRLYERHGWPVIDVSRRSVEETAAAILNLLSQREFG